MFTYFFFVGPYITLILRYGILSARPVSYTHLDVYKRQVQNIIRDDICHGRYDHSIGQTPTAYFLGKVCVAKYLDPKIPEVFGDQNRISLRGKDYQCSTKRTNKNHWRYGNAIREL